MKILLLILNRSTLFSKLGKIKIRAVVLTFLVWVSIPVLANPRVNNAATTIKGDLTKKDLLILNQGEISTWSYLVGGAIGPFVGFGTGHAIQGRFKNKGMLFVGADAASAFGFVAGSIATCGLQGRNHDELLCRNFQAVAVGAFVAVRIWEAYDLWFVPPRENERYRELTNKRQSSSVNIRPYLAPLSSNSIAAGVGISF